MATEEFGRETGSGEKKWGLSRMPVSREDGRCCEGEPMDSRGQNLSFRMAVRRAAFLFEGVVVDVWPERTIRSR